MSRDEHPAGSTRQMTSRDQYGSDMLTVLEASKLLRIGERTAYDLIRRNEFPGGAAMKIGGLWRVSRPRLERFLHGTTNGPEAA